MKMGLKMGGRVLIYYLVMMVLSMSFLATIDTNTYWLQAALNIALFAGLELLLYNDGGYRGERASTLGVTLERQLNEGKRLDPTLEKQVFEKKHAYIGYLSAALPLLILAILNLAVEPYYPPVIIEDAAVEEAAIEEALKQAQDGMPVEEIPSGEEAAPAETPAEAPAETPAEPVELPPINWVNVVSRVVFSPFVALYHLFAKNPHGLNLIFLLCALLTPIGEAVGYLSGPRLRKKKLEDIQKGKKRKMRNLKVNKKPREPHEPKREV